MTSSEQAKVKVVIIARPYDAQVMGDALVQAGYEPELVDFDDQPLAIVARLQPQAVVVSLRKTQRQEGALLAQLRDQANGAACSLLLVSETGGQGATPDEARQLGADQLLLRPLDEQQLAATLEELLAARQEVAAPPPAAQPPAPASAADLGQVQSGSPQEKEEELDQFAQATTVSLDSEAEPGFEDLTRESRRGAAAVEPSTTPPLGVPRSGDLRLMELPHLLQLIGQEGVTGQLQLRCEQTTKSICFDGGQPVWASSNQPHDHLEALLYREGKITAEQLARLQQQAGESQQLSTLLVDEGHIKQKELFPLLRHQVAEIIYSLFAWTEGEFQLDFEEPLPAERVALELRPLELMLEGLRRKYSLDRLQQLVGPPDTLLVIHKAALSRFKRAGLSVEERQILDLLDGERTLAGIAAAGPWDLKSVFLVAYAALAAGAALLRGGGSGPAALSEQGEQRREEAVDRQRILAKHAQVCEGDYFSLLGLRPNASEREIQLAYQRMRRDYDVAQLPQELRAEYLRELQEITEALEEAFLVLSDEQLRQAYREHL